MSNYRTATPKEVITAIKVQLSLDDYMDVTKMNVKELRRTLDDYNRIIKSNVTWAQSQEWAR